MSLVETWTRADCAVFRRTLAEGAVALRFPLDEAQVELCEAFAVLLIEGTTRMNLTRIVTPAEVAVKHFLDSLTVLIAVPDLPQGAEVVDVGTGAGFPGIVLKLLRPDIRLYLLDSLRKRVGFLSETVGNLGLSGVETLNLRAEEAGKMPRLRDRFGLVTARALAPLPMLVEYCGPLVRPQTGRLVAMKGPEAGAEIAALQGGERQLRMMLMKEFSVFLPITEDEAAAAERHLLVYGKTGATPPKFPRTQATMKQQPLQGG